VGLIDIHPESSLFDVTEEKINKRNGETEKEGGEYGKYRCFYLPSALFSPPFLRSSCSLSSDLCDDDPKLV
jgi:hypothetical protein